MLLKNITKLLLIVRKEELAINFIYDFDSNGNVLIR